MSSGVACSSSVVRRQMERFTTEVCCVNPLHAATTHAATAVSPHAAALCSGVHPSCSCATTASTIAAPPRLLAWLTSSGMDGER